MATLRSKAKAYEPKKTLNICDLKSVSTELDIVTKKFNKDDGEEFSVNVVEVDGLEYRVPMTVVQQLKELLADNPDMLSFKVRKSGEGMKTKYTVIPL